MPRHVVDRGSVSINSQPCYDIEKEGHRAADKVVAVSDLTRNIVINKYGIDDSRS